MSTKTIIEEIENMLMYSDLQNYANKKRKNLLRQFGFTYIEIQEVSSLVAKKMLSIKQYLPQYLALFCYNRIFDKKEYMQTYHQQYIEYTLSDEDLTGLMELAFACLVVDTVSSLVDGKEVSWNTKMGYLLTEYTGKIEEITYDVDGVCVAQTIMYTVEMELQKVLHDTIVELIQKELRNYKQSSLLSEKDIGILSRALYEDVRRTSHLDHLFHVRSLLTIDNYVNRPLSEIISLLDNEKFEHIF